MNRKISILIIMLLIMNSLVIVQSSVSNLTSTGEILRGDEEKNNFSDDSFFEEWNVTFGGSNIDIGHSVQQTTDNGFITVGYTRSYGESSGRNIWLIKTDTFGNEEWKHSFMPLTEVSCDFSKNRWVIENTGRIGAYNLSLTSQIEGSIFGGVYEQTGQFIIIPPGEQQKVNILRLFGFGKVTIDLLVEGLNIDPTTCSVTGFLIGPFFFKT